MGRKKTGFDELVEERRASCSDDEAGTQEVGGNIVTNDPDAPGLARGTMELLIGYIRRTAEIDDELSRRGADPLIAEKADIHDKVKEIMLDGGPDVAFDESSGWEAVLAAPRKSDVWDLQKFKRAIKPSQRERYIVEAIATGAVADGLKNGDLSRAALEQKGAVRVEYGSRALSIRERKKKASRPATQSA